MGTRFIVPHGGQHVAGGSRLRRSWPAVYNHLRYDPSLRPLHRDPRVRAMLERGARWLAEKQSG